MRIREYTPADFDALRRLHAAQNFGYPLPDLDSPLFVTKLVLEDDGRTSFSLSDSRAWNDAEKCDRLKPVPPKILDAQSREPGDSREVASRASPAAEASSPEEIAACAEASRNARTPRILMAVLLRLTAEAYLLHDPVAGTPRRRWQHFLALHEAALRAAAARGLDDAQGFLPPRVARVRTPPGRPRLDAGSVAVLYATRVSRTGPGRIGGFDFSLWKSDQTRSHVLAAPCRLSLTILLAPIPQAEACDT